MLIRGRVLGLEFECVFLIRSVTCWQLNWIRALASEYIPGLKLVIKSSDVSTGYC